MQHPTTVAAIKRQLTPSSIEAGPEAYPWAGIRHDYRYYPAAPSPPLDLPPILNRQFNDNRLPSPASPKSMTTVATDDMTTPCSSFSPPSFLEPAPQLDKNCYTSSVFHPHLSLSDVSFRSRIIDRRATLPSVGEKPKYHASSSSVHKTEMHVPIPRRQSYLQSGRDNERNRFRHRRSSPPAATTAPPALIQPKASSFTAMDRNCTEVIREDRRKRGCHSIDDDDDDEENENRPIPGVISPIMAAASATAAAASRESQKQPGGLIVETMLNSLRLTKPKQPQGKSDEIDNLNSPGDMHDSSDTHVSFMVYGNHSPPSSVVDHNMFLTKNAHIKRPRNAWIHFRCHYGQALKTQDPTLRADEISKRASRRWARLTEQEKKPWHDMADQEKQAHREAFPEYRYCPKRSANSTSTASTTTNMSSSCSSSSSPTSTISIGSSKHHLSHVEGHYGSAHLSLERDRLSDNAHHDHFIHDHRQKRARRRAK